MEELTDVDFLDLLLSTMWENTDGCAKQYPYANSILIWYCLTNSSNGIIGHAISAPSNGEMLYLVSLLMKKYL